MKADSLGDRMKAYEHAFRHQLPKRMPVILRVDGRSFHTLTAHCERPYDGALAQAMDSAALALCAGIQGAQIAYTQSDEISVLIHNYKRFASQAWFDNEIQKMCSIAAAIATNGFNGEFRFKDSAFYPPLNGETAQFDARVFVLPEADVCNYFIWRQQDATRNSLQMMARSMYSHKELFEKKEADLHELIHAKGKNWNDMDAWEKRGRCVRKRCPENDKWTHASWFADYEIPVFSQDRTYIEDLLVTEDE